MTVRELLEEYGYTPEDLLDREIGQWKTATTIYVGAQISTEGTELEVRFNKKAKEAR